jgi:hypothetical protein
MNELFELLIVEGAKIDLKINTKKTKLLWLGISEDEMVMFGNKKIGRSICEPRSEY